MYYNNKYYWEHKKPPEKLAYTPTLENTVSNLDETRISYEQLVANNFHQTKRCP